MSVGTLKAWAGVLVLCAAGLFAGQPGDADAQEKAGAAPAPAAENPDNASCLRCHDGKKKLEVPLPDGAGDEEDGEEGGGARELTPVDPAKFAGGVHSGMACVDCHVSIANSDAPHEKVPGAKDLGCIACHEALWEDAKKANLTKEKARLGVVVENIEAYRKSFHARINKEDKTRVYATCSDCHNVHSFDIPPEGTAARARWRLRTPELCGESCHTDQLEEYVESVHGKEIAEGNIKAAVCSDCHTAHAVANTSASPTKLAITASCGNCHEDNYESYRNTYHGQIMTLGYANTGKCFDCHGSHGILPVDDPESKVHPDNRLKTCRQCHTPRKGLPEATPGFVTFEPHGTIDDFERFPQIWLAAKFMLALLVGTFAFFWTHTLLWFYREYKERKARQLRPHVKVEALPPEAIGKHYQRFPALWRAAHLLFALSTMTLTLTGMPLFFPDAIWAPVIIKTFGGPQIAGIVHRTAASVFIGIFLLHLVYVVVRIARNWKTFRFFGPDSFLPNWQDIKDIGAMFRWFFGKGPRPVFERWTYWEKFDYWAPFWGVTIIGVSGLMMWFPHITASYLPGWVFNVAMIFHSEEAILAVVFLFTVHFFNNHFRPDKFPLDIVMFTGTFTLEEFRHEHRREYERLVRTGELKKYLVDAPSRPMTLGSKILGFTLIATGLSLLSLVAVGFFGGGN